MDKHKLFSDINGLGIGSFDFLKNYFEVDCEIPEEYGMFIQGLYENKDMMLLQHKFSIKNEPQKWIESCEKGKIESTHQEIGNRDLKLTTTGMFNNTAGLIEFLNNDGINKILIQIPVKAFEEDNNIPIWGSDSENERSYILPNYVIGMVNSNFEFEENPIPEEERKRYKYVFKNRGKEPIERLGQSHNDYAGKTDISIDSITKEALLSGVRSSSMERAENQMQQKIQKEQKSINTDNGDVQDL